VTAGPADGTPLAEPPATDTATGDAQGRRPVILITGLSGAGLSTALKTLEDLGYEAVDNLPMALVPGLVALDGDRGADLVADRGGDRGRPLAISIDCRTRDFSAAALRGVMEGLDARGDLAVSLLLVVCDDEVLQRRFTETRRRHPLAGDRPVADGIRRERALLAPLFDVADETVDTSILSIHELRRWLGGRFALDAGPALFVTVQSFAFRRGLPRESDLVFDVRFLANPHWDPALRPLTGLDPAVRAAVERDPGFPGFFDDLTRLLAPLLPRYQQEGKSYLTIAIGCTGGQHRSVCIAERLAGWLGESAYKVAVVHRDLPAPGVYPAV